MRLEILRFEHNKTETLGVLKINGRAFCTTLENPYLDNERYVSCIPTGVYPCKKTVSKTFGETLRVLTVPNRTSIIFHVGNTAKCTEGCILLGERFGYLGSERAVLNSGVAVEAFRKAIEYAGVTILEITDIRT